MRPNFRKPGDDVNKKVEEKVKSEVESKVKTEIDKRVNEILKEREDKEKAEKANKLARAVDVAKAIKGESDKDKVTVATAAEKITVEKAKHDDVLCPTCHDGHVHRIETNGLSVKCTGPNCGKEYVLVDKTADYQCATCGVPIKKPNDPKSIEGCPFCSGKKAFKYDWSKTWKVLNK